MDYVKKRQGFGSGLVKIWLRNEMENLKSIDNVNNFVTRINDRNDLNSLEWIGGTPCLPC